MTLEQLNAIRDWVLSTIEGGEEDTYKRETMYDAFGFAAHPHDGEAIEKYELEELRKPTEVWEACGHPTIGYKFAVRVKGRKPLHYWVNVRMEIVAYSSWKNAKRKARELNGG